MPGAELSAEQRARAREIFEDGFGEELRSDFDGLFADVLLAFVEDDRVVGLAVLRPLGETGWVFLRYFVAGVRGRGTGSRMWQVLRAAMADYDRIVLDVEDPAETGIDAAEREIRERRIVFYERLGIIVLPVRDYVPPHGDHDPQLLLLTSDAGPVPDVRAIVLGTYAHRYGLPADHPTVRRTLAASGLG